jgi:hypothetical protein
MKAFWNSCFLLSIFFAWHPAGAGPGSSGGNPAMANLMSLRLDFMMRGPYPTSVKEGASSVTYGNSLIGEEVKVERLISAPGQCVITGSKTVCMESVSGQTATGLVVFAPGNAYRVTVHGMRMASDSDMRLWLETVALGFVTAIPK